MSAHKSVKARERWGERLEQTVQMDGDMFPPEFYERADSSPDPAFYFLPRLVTHIDDHAIAAVGALYDELGITGQVLDLMGSWVSHFRTPPARLTVLGQTNWSITDTTFTAQVAEMKAAGADAIVISGHAATTCGVLREMMRQAVRPRVLVGLTSSSTAETLAKCGVAAEGLLIPTSFVPNNPEARAAAEAVEHAGGIADLHSMAAWEIVMTLATLMEQEGVLGTHESIAIDRGKLRDGLAHLTTMHGLLGPIGRSADREARKPFVLVQARGGVWRVVYAPPPARY